VGAEHRRPDAQQNGESAEPARGPVNGEAGLDGAGQGVPGFETAIADFTAELLTRAERGEVMGIRARLIEHLEAEMLRQAIERARGNQSKAAHWLGVTRRTIRERLAQYHVRPNALEPRGSRFKPTPPGDGAPSFNI
jgi:DNA-binding protein Fis